MEDRKKPAAVVLFEKQPAVFLMLAAVGGITHFSLLLSLTALYLLVWFSTGWRRRHWQERRRRHCPPLPAAGSRSVQPVRWKIADKLIIATVLAIAFGGLLFAAWRSRP